MCVGCVHRVMAEVQTYLSGAAAVKGKAAEPVLLALVNDVSPSTKRLYEYAMSVEKAAAGGAAAGAAAGAGGAVICTCSLLCAVLCCPVLPICCVFIRCA